MARKPRETHRGMHPEDIRAFLRKKFGTIAAYSRQIGRTGNAVSNTIAQPGYSVPIEGLIAEELGKTPYDTWGDERYLEDGTPVSIRAPRGSATAIAADHRRKEVAA